MTCKWNGTTNPRTLAGRHTDECADETCPGCQPCTHPHCRICGTAHAEGTCGECMAETREALRDIARMCDALPTEVEHRGVEGEAMFLLGPVADPEAWRQRGRHGHKFDFDAQLGDNHPTWVLGTWEQVYRDELNHVSHDPVDLADAVDYLDRNLTYAGGYGEVPFEDFARDLRRCRTLMEAVLHDGEQHDRGAPCMACGAALERTWGSDEKADGWKCPRCKRTSTEAQYRFAVAHLHREEAEWLTDREMEIRTGVRAGTVRVWARREKVARRLDSGRIVYCVADVVAQIAS